MLLVLQILLQMQQNTQGCDFNILIMNNWIDSLRFCQYESKIVQIFYN